MKKEKYYLFAMGSGFVLNIILSITLGLTAFKDNPSIGVAIGTMVVDIGVFIFLVIKCWKWIKKPLFNLNTLKLIIGNVIVLFVALTCIYWAPIKNLWAESISIYSTTSYLIELVVTTLICAIAYLAFLAIVKEDLVYSLIRRGPKQEEI